MGCVVDDASRQVLIEARDFYKKREKFTYWFLGASAAVAGATWSAVAFWLGYSMAKGAPPAGSPILWTLLLVSLAALHPFASYALYRVLRHRELNRRLRNPSPIELAIHSIEKAEQRTRKKAADARHAENRQMQQEVLAWWDMHKGDPGMTKDKAADHIAGKLVPLKWRTVRDYLKGV